MPSGRKGNLLRRWYGVPSLAKRVLAPSIVKALDLKTGILVSGLVSAEVMFHGASVAPDQLNAAARLLSQYLLECAETR